ncbi:unnamed protein product [Urochloa humidicola]
MAPTPTLASGEREGDAAPEPPGRPPPPTTPPTTSPVPIAANPHCATAIRPAPTSSSPAPQARPRLRARRGGGATLTSRTHARPGELTENRLLTDYHATAVPGAIAPAPPVPIWVTPLSRDSRYSLTFVRNMLNFSLTAKSSRLEVKRVGVLVFRVLVSCRNVAIALVVRGTIRMGSSELLPHLTREAADTAAKAAGKVEEQFTAAHQCAQPANGPQLLLRAARDNTAPFTAKQNSKGKIDQDFTQAVSATPDVPPLAGAPTCCVDSGLTQLAVTPGVNATHQAAAPYLRALQTPSKPPKTLATRPTPITSTTGCFRCLAADHKVRDCRDPERCRNCRGYGHRTARCPMPIARVLTPMPRHRRPTIPNPSQRATVNAVPFSPRSTSPPPPTAPPPPTPEHLHATLAAAFDPLCLIPSSSSGEPDFELPKKKGQTAVDTLKAGTVAPRSPRRVSAHEAKGEPPASPPRQVYPRSVDIHVVSSRGKAPVNFTSLPSSVPPSPERRSPPRAESPPLAPPTNDAAVAAPGDAVASSEGGGTWAYGDPSDLPSDEEEIESGDISSDGDEAEHDPAPSEAGSDLEDWEGRVHSLEVWMPRGRLDVAARLAFAYVAPPEVGANTALFIRAAISSVAPQIHVELLPSSRGAMLLRFTCHEDREYVRLQSPIVHNGGELTLERPQETSNRFFRTPDWLAYVAVVDYPPEHWELEHIKNSFRGFCNVVEVDPACLTGFDYSPLRLVIEVIHRLEIPSEVWVDAEESELGGSIVQILPIRIWPRTNQVGPDGQLIPFFPPAPIPPNQPAPPAPLGLAGPQLPAPPQYQAQQPQQHFGYGPNHAYLLHLSALLACTKLLPAASTTHAGVNVPAQILTAAPPALEAVPPVTPPAMEAVPLVPQFPDPAQPAEDEEGELPPPAPIAQKRQSSRLAAMNNGKFVHSTDKAMQRKALKNTLVSCSSQLKAVVEKRNILTRDKLPLSVTDLRKMVTAAGLGQDAASAIGVVPTVPE